MKIPMSEIKTHFESIYPELFSRVKHYSRKFEDRYEAIAEMVASSWVNQVQKAQRCGTLLSASSLAFMAFRRLRAGRVMCGYSMADAMAEQTYRAGRVKVFMFSQVAAPRHQSAVPDDTVNSIVNALTTRWRERPDVRAAVRIDWAAFSVKLPVRMQNILKWLAVGHSKSAIGRKLGISPGRVTQILYLLADELKAFFGEDIVPLAS